MKFKVNVIRIGYASKEIEVEAETAESAKEKALDEAGNHLYSEHTSDYEVDWVSRTEGVNS